MKPGAERVCALVHSARLNSVCPSLTRRLSGVTVKLGRTAPLVAAVVRPVARQLARIEGLLIELSATQDAQLKRIRHLQVQVDEIAATRRRRR
jgi:hypothetical protein